ncbi:MAG: hypothetical protein HRF45_00070 [Fimbriimonadia bacterium]|jgi:putative FmdB family regulatory protein
MPLIEFLCRRCGHRFSQLLGVTADSQVEPCPKCGSTDLVRAVSRFRPARSEEDRLDELADRIETMGEPESPREMRELAREMGKALDDDMSDEMEEMLETDAGEDENL